MEERVVLPGQVEAISAHRADGGEDPRQKLQSEIDFIRQIGSRALDAHDEMVGNLTSAQKSGRLMRALREQRERISTLVICGNDAQEAFYAATASPSIPNVQGPGKTTESNAK